MKRLLIVLTLAVVVAGCGRPSSDGVEEDGSAAAASGSPAIATVGSPLRIGPGMEPAWTPGGGLVYSAFDGDDRDLFLRAPDGSGVRTLTASPAFDMLPAVAVDARLAWIEADDDGFRLVVADSPAGLPRPVPLHGLELSLAAPAWSPDGTVTAVVVGGDGEPDLVGLDPDGGPPVPVVVGPGYDGQPSWSADGRLAFTSDRGGSLDLWTFDPDGTPVRLTRDPGAEEHPTWSPDGRHIAFVSDRTEDREIHVVATDGTGEALRLTRDGGRSHAPAWSPDGSILAYALVRSGRTDDDLMLVEVQRAPR